MMHCLDYSVGTSFAVLSYGRAVRGGAYDVNGTAEFTGRS
jgi:hypothetical protein